VRRLSGTLAGGSCAADVSWAVLPAAAVVRRSVAASRYLEGAVTAGIGNIAFDCDDALKVATFWSAVLGRPLGKGSSRGFASIGGSDPDRREPAWYF
jgi:hypothetical protein